MNSWLIKLSQASFNFLPNEGNVFRNCIMVINNFWTVDGTGYLLLVMVEKGITIIINIKDWTLWPVPSPVTAARANASSVFQLFSFLVVCSVMISKGFGFVAFFVSEEASSFCIQPKTDLAVTIQSTTLSWMEAKNPPQNKYCHKSQSAFIRCMSALVKVTHSLNHDGSPWQVYSRTCHRSCLVGRIACQHCRGNLWSSHVYCKGMATEIPEGWASSKA
jgi:hypothetical protein